MSKSLPAHPSLEHLKSQAKDLLAAAKEGDPAALARFKASLPSAGSGVDRATIALHDAQSVVAREYGEESWSALRERVLATPSEAALRSLFEPHHSVALPREVLEAAAGMGVPLATPLGFASPLPFLALDNALVSVSTVAPLDVSRGESLTAIEAARAGDGLLAIFARVARESNGSTTMTTTMTTTTTTTTTKGQAGDPELHPVGCVARIVRVLPKPEGGAWLVVQGLAWVRLVAIVDGRARVVPFEIVDDVRASGETERLRETVTRAVAKMPDPDAIVRRIARMTPLELADAAVANAPSSVADKAAYAAEPSLSKRVARALALIG